MCYCSALPRIDTATRVVILQHPRERNVPIGTAHMASLCLPQAELHVGVHWAAERIAGILADPSRPPILLYPGPAARDILREPPRGPVTLVVVDGTWSQARTVVRDNPALQALPRYAFATPEPSHYRIRREPRAEYVSTIEALMHVLGALEGEPARFRSLLDPLRAMVDAQIACQASSPRRGVRQPRPPRPPRRLLPGELTGRFGDLVCVVGEANAWPYRSRIEPGQQDLTAKDHPEMLETPRRSESTEGRAGAEAREGGAVPAGAEGREGATSAEEADSVGGREQTVSAVGWDGAVQADRSERSKTRETPEKPETDGRRDRWSGRDRDDEIVHWVACRVATEQAFDLIVAPERPLSPSTAFHVELAEEVLLRGATRSELLRRFAAFTRSGDVFCAWGHYGLDLAIAAGIAPGERFDLRAHARRIANRKLGSLEEYAASLGPPPPPLAPGRAGRRLALLVQVLRAWHVQDGKI